MDATEEQRRIVFVAQLPPPVHGQAVANQLLAAGDYRSLDVRVIPMTFSRDIESVGRASFGKVRHAVELVRRMRRAATEADALVYPVGMRNRIGLYRDLLVLLGARRRYLRTVFLVHSGDVGAFLETRNPLLRFAVERAYGDADAAVYLDPSLATPAGQLPRARAVRYLPYGVEVDEQAPAPAPAGSTAPAPSTPNDVPLVVFLGNLYESKGPFDLVEAAARVRERGHALRVQLLGAMPDADVEQRMRRLIADRGLEEVVTIEGPVDAAAKWAALRNADIFCFPTRYEGEAMPLVVIEAMAAGLPVLTTRWRAIPALVEDGVNGLLVAPGDVDALTRCLEELVRSPKLRKRLGGEGRCRFERRHSADRYRSGFERIVSEVIAG